MSDEEAAVDIPLMRSRSKETLSGPQPVDLESLQNAEIEARRQALGDYRTPTAGELQAPGVVLSLDLLLALTIADLDEPANPWNRGLILEELGRFEEAAHEYVMAAERTRSRLARGIRLVDDDEQWADAAFLNACRCLLKTGLPLAAAAAARQIEDAEYKAEARAMIDSQADA